MFALWFGKPGDVSEAQARCWYSFQLIVQKRFDIKICYQLKKACLIEDRLKTYRMNYEMNKEIPQFPIHQIHAVIFEKLQNKKPWAITLTAFLIHPCL